MSLLMFQTFPDGAFVVTDTLATTLQGDPFIWTTKAALVPHLDLVVAGTGAAPLIDRWRAQLNAQVLCRDVEMLDRFTPEVLRSIWVEILAEASVSPSEVGTATVYHFGRRERDGTYLAYAYRSTSGFDSELLQYGFGVKPVPEVEVIAPEQLEQWIAIAEQVRGEQDARPKAERIHIGGDLVMIQLFGGVATARRVYRWPDFEDHWLDMHRTIEGLTR